MGWGAELKLDSITSGFITKLRNDSKQCGFCQGDAVIDFSGNLPGAVFAMGGLMPVFPWLSAGSPFSSYFAQKNLKRLVQSHITPPCPIHPSRPNPFSHHDL